MSEVGIINTAVSLLTSLLLICTTAYIGISLLVFIFQPSFIYFPEKEIYATPDQAGLEYEEVHFKSSDGVDLHGWFIPAAQNRGTLLFFHGNAGNISHRLESLQIFNRLGVNSFIFDYRGYGMSGGKPSEKGTYLDAEAARSYLISEKGLAGEDIILFGRSMGGSIAARLASNHRPAALIIESSFTSVKKLAADLYPWLATRYLTRFRYDTAFHMNRVEAPVLIIHSADDEIIPFKHGKALYASAKGPKVFLEIKGGHNDGFIRSIEPYTKGLDSFITTYTGKTKGVSSREKT